MNERVKEFNNNLVWQHLTERLGSPTLIGGEWVWPTTLLSKFVVAGAKYPAALIKGKITADTVADERTDRLKVTVFGGGGAAPDVFECAARRDGEIYRLVANGDISFSVEDHQDRLIANYASEKLKRSFKDVRQEDKFTFYGDTLASEFNEKGHVGFFYREDDVEDWQGAFVVGADVHQVEFLVPGCCTIYVKHRLGKAPVVTVHH